MNLALIAAIVVPAALGYLLVTVLLGDDRETGVLERLCLAYPLGMGLVTLQMFLLGLLRVPLTLGPVAAPPLIEAAALLGWALHRRIPLFPRRTSGLWTDLADGSLSGVRRAVMAALALWTAVKLFSVFLETSLRPIYAWDTWANWSVGAKLFLASGSLLLDAPPGDFFGVGVISRFGSYPLHNPLTQVWISLWTGGFDEILVKFSSPVVFTSVAVSLYLLMSREAGRLISLGLLVLLVSSPLLSYHAIELYSDLPLSAAIVLALASFFHAMRGRDGHWPLVGLFSAVALWTKDEALFFVLPLMLSASVHLWQVRERRPGTTARFAALLAPLALALPWYVFKFSRSFGLGAEGVNQGFTFHPEVVKTLVELLLSLDSFNVLILFLPLLLLAAGRPDRTFVHLAAPVAAYLLFFLLLYSLTVYYHQYFNNGTVVFRNLMTAYPSVCLLCSLLVKKVMDLSEPLPAARSAKKKRSR